MRSFRWGLLTLAAFATLAVIVGLVSVLAVFSVPLQSMSTRANVVLVMGVLLAFGTLAANGALKAHAHRHRAEVETSGLTVLHNGVLFVVLVTVSLAGSVRFREHIAHVTTMSTLSDMRTEIRGACQYGRTPPRSDLYPADKTGQMAVLNFVLSQAHTDPEVRETMRGAYWLHDGWGHEILYRCPGPVHTHGWDLYSVGPNAVDDQGQGDDVLVGDDMAPLGSGT